jgi:hypothetical protein
MIREGDRIRTAGAGENAGREQGTRAGGGETRRAAQNQPPAPSGGASPAGSTN